MTPRPPPAEYDLDLTESLTGVLTDRLVQEMTSRWQNGDAPLAEEFLDRHPELWKNPELAADLIYQEWRLRSERGDADATMNIIQRFPQWSSQLEILLDCHRLLEDSSPSVDFPEPGQNSGEFHLLSDLGGGAQGRVYLATQPALANRQIVVKLSPHNGQEHLSLARLQHTNIVPLYGVHDDVGRGLRILSFPYFGGATLAALLDRARDIPPGQLDGKRLLELLDQESPPDPPAAAPGPARDLLARLSYVEAICWIGAVLADALHHAHERGLVHLDVKPANVLIAADGQPMLLDFHLAREPLAAEQPAPESIGGTLAFMSPEQQAALAAVGEQGKIPLPVDGRADVYSLGAMLYRTLGGTLPFQQGVSPPLKEINPRVSTGLSDIIQKALSPRACDRYPTAAALARDLERHLAHLPLQGVANKSLHERWQKWRRRRPDGLVTGGTLLAVFFSFLAVGLSSWGHMERRVREARACLQAGQASLEQGNHEEAQRIFSHGWSLVETLPFHSDLRQSLRFQRDLAAQSGRIEEKRQRAQDLHRLAEQLRLAYGMEQAPPGLLEALELQARPFWERRRQILERLGTDSEIVTQAQADLLDIAILLADLTVRRAPPAEALAARQQALQLLDEAERQFPASAVLLLEQARHWDAMGDLSQAAALQRRAAALPCRTAWEHYALGRSQLAGGNPAQARLAFQEVLASEPGHVWARFCLGVCDYHLAQYQEAALAFSVCMGSRPDGAVFAYNRGLSLAALGKEEAAILDFDQALRLNPSFAAAAYQRGILRLKRHEFPQGIADVWRALELNQAPDP